MADNDNNTDTNTVTNGNISNNNNTKMNIGEDQQQQENDKEFQIREAVRLNMEQKLQEELKKIREKVSQFFMAFLATF